MAIGKYFVLILPSINIELFNGGLPMSSANSMPVEVYKILYDYLIISYRYQRSVVMPIFQHTFGQKVEQ